jgi:hypothetical protein
MADYWEQWFANPAQNNQAPPYGAGEKKMQFDQITDTFRVVMAACKQLGDRITSGLGSMSKQNANNVSISGGDMSNVQIYSTNVIDAGAIKAGTVSIDRIPKQQIYNLIYPVGTTVIWWNTNAVESGLVWPGVIATWSYVADQQDRYLVTAGAETISNSGAGTTGIVPPTSSYGAPTGGGYNLVTNENPRRYAFVVLRRIS